MNAIMKSAAVLPILLCAVASACGTGERGQRAGTLSDAQVENLVRRSYQYVAMYNVNNKFAQTLGWNTCAADTRLKDHTMRDIARPNNDTFYITCMVDVRNDPVLLDMPAFDSRYASLMVTGYDHYVNIPMATRLGNFGTPSRILLYSARTEGYDGEPVEGVDQYFEATGDFLSAVIRLMPHASEPERMARITEQAKSVTLVTLSQYKGGEAKPVEAVEFPPVGTTDADVFEHNLPEVMQFVFNHTTFDRDNADDQAVLAAYRPLGIEPGKVFAADAVAPIDGARVRAVAERIQRETLADMARFMAQPDFSARMFQPKGETDLETVLAMSITGPIGMPREEAMYPAVATADGQPMNAMHDYVVRMTKDELPPAGAFWSLTLYDLAQGFFIPNDRKKYSVGANAGIRLNPQGGIEIYITAEQPAGVPIANWLPIERKDLDLNLILRIYVPDLERMKTWTPPVAERVGE